MKTWMPITITVLCSNSALADTITIEATGHYVRLNDPNMVELEGDNEAYLGYDRHIAVEGKDGQTESHWCSGTNVMDDDGLSFGGGYCMAIDEDGDAYWIWIQVRPKGGFDWQVMGGTGKYRGSTGEGESRASKMLPDGSATLEIRGVMELADR